MTKKPRVKAGTNPAAAVARRKAFVQAYLANGRNATQAAITAGYSAKTARSKGSQLLADVNVSAQVAVALEKSLAITGLTAERTLQELARIAYADPRRMYREDGTLIPVNEMDDDVAATIASVEVEGIKAGDKEVGRTTKVKVWDKARALEMSMKHLGLFEKDNSQLVKPVSIKMVFE